MIFLLYVVTLKDHIHIQVDNNNNKCTVKSQTQNILKSENFQIILTSVVPSGGGGGGNQRPHQYN
jgi:hypothetical protein